MTDRELLEQAAKAAGIELYTRNIHTDKKVITDWNPLTDDGDALRLAVKLGIDIRFWLDHVSVDNCTDDQTYFEDYGNDPYAATRRAIVRAAAEIGKDMK